MKIVVFVLIFCITKRALSQNTGEKPKCSHLDGENGRRGCLVVYFYITKKARYPDQSDLCEAYGGNLARIQNMKQARLVNNLPDFIFEPNVNPESADLHYFLGGKKYDATRPPPPLS